MSNQSLVRGNARNHNQIVQKSWCPQCRLGVITCGNDEEDPFLEADAQTEIHSLITETTPNDTCPVNEYLSGDDDLAVCVLE